MVATWEPQLSGRAGPTTMVGISSEPCGVLSCHLGAALCRSSLSPPPPYGRPQDPMTLRHDWFGAASKRAVDGSNLGLRLDHMVASQLPPARQQAGGKHHSPPIPPPPLLSPTNTCCFLTRGGGSSSSQCH